MPLEEVFAEIKQQITDYNHIMQSKEPAIVYLILGMLGTFCNLYTLSKTNDLYNGHRSPIDTPYKHALADHAPSTHVDQHHG